ncbi:MAG TPA: DUF86 domain-containing protein [Pseudobdellovibrionaceae bacterium]|nr:DUF86 domain-containing protein [Pseudobdellovibrionaceae bacterium]
MIEKDVIYSKINIIKNCLMAIEKVKVQEQDKDFQLGLYELNLQRAAQACIDMANVILSKEGLGLPNSYKQSFVILNRHGIISSDLTKKMTSMVGFRNISVHDYEQIKPEIVESIVTHNLKDLEEFYTIIFKHVNNSW